MQTEPIAAFFMFAIVAAVTPGPSVALVMVAGARSGFVGGLRCLAGVVAGMAVMMAAANLGLGGLILAVPFLLVALKWCGAAFLLWLAWKVASAPAMGDVHGQATAGFWAALAFQWVNPKSWIVSISAASTYGVAVDDNLLVRAAIMAAVFSAAAAPSCALWLAFGSMLRQWLANPRRSRVFNVTMGVLLALSVALVLK